MNTTEMLRVFRKHAVAEFFWAMRVAVVYRKGQNGSKRIALHLMSIMARPPI